MVSTQKHALLTIFFTAWHACQWRWRPGDGARVPLRMESEEVGFRVCEHAI
jgi:hypothetical protein